MMHDYIMYCTSLKRTGSRWLPFLFSLIPKHTLKIMEVYLHTGKFFRGLAGRRVSHRPFMNALMAAPVSAAAEIFMEISY